MQLNVKLPAFEGPLALLLHLINKNKVDIYDIPIAEITDQYLAYIADMEEVDLDLMSDFLLMAATLLDIKARMLLPEPEPDEDEEEEDPRAELVARLIEYRRYKLLSGELRDIAVGSEQLVFRPECLPKEVAEYKPPVDLDSLLVGVDLLKLKQIFEDVLKQHAEREEQKKKGVGRITHEVIPIETGIRSVRRAVRRAKRQSFRKLFKGKKTRDEVIVTFLAVLELLKEGDLRLTQDEDGDDLILEVNDHDGKNKVDD
ncbi:MAG: segregation/condensation protein A [Lachnospiraceae bacterium]|nr:segregation/condensation protein A [Lachnospiraceae bacterium]